MRMKEDFALWSKRLLNTFWYLCLIITIGAIILFIGLVINGEYEIKFKEMCDRQDMI